MYRIMVVDDEPSLNDLVTMSLLRMGYEVVGAAESGHEAVAEARRLKPDLILMDIRMPGKIDGITAAEKVRNELNIPVVFISGYTDRETIERAKRANPLDFIQKPIRYDEFEVAIEMAVHKNEVEQRLRESEEMYRASVAEWLTTFDAIRDGVFLMDNRGKILRHNRAMRGFLKGGSADEIVGCNCWEKVHGVSEPIRDCPLVRARESGQRETLVFSENGRWFEYRVDPLMDEGSVTGAVHIISDITPMKEAEEVLRIKHDELERMVSERTVELEREIDERKQTEKALKQSENELRQLSARLLEAHEEESRRIGRELHDGLAQTLSAIKAWAESALVHMNADDYTELGGSLERVVSLVKGAVGEVRGITNHLRPSTIDDLGILTTISSLCHEYEVLLPGVSIGKQIDIEEHNVPDPLKIVMYRILQEAMNNISKHSDAKSVRIGLAATNGKIELSVDDDGVGFDVNRVRAQVQPEKGLGLTSMRERTELSGGAFAIRAAEGNGTNIRASWQV
jgi:PAS domain S-box-containing protein